MTTIYVAEALIPGTESDWQTFVSLDEETYLPVNRKPEKETIETDADEIRQLFEGRDGWKPMTFARRYLHHMNASFGWVCGE